MNFSKIFFLTLIIFPLVSCVQDDFVDDFVEPELRLITNLQSLKIDESFQLDYIYLNNIGQAEEVDVLWTSSDESIVSVTETGLITALEPGMVIINIEALVDEVILTDEVLLEVTETETVVEEVISLEGTIVTTSSYILTGDFTLTETVSGVELLIADNYRASSALPGLFIYLSNNRNSIANALEISEVRVFNGAHQYDIPGVGINDFSHIVYFCKPFNVKVGEAELQ